MTIGGVVVVGGIAFVGLCVYGVSFDIRGQLEAYHARKLLQEIAAKEHEADILAQHIHRAAVELRDEIEALEAVYDYEAEALMYSEFASTLENIRDLDEIVGVEDV